MRLYEPTLVTIVAGHEMDVRVEDVLAGVYAVVHAEVVAGRAKGLSNFWSEVMDNAHEFDRIFHGARRQVLGVRLRDQQRVAFADRKNIQKGQDFFILINLVARDFTGHNLTEETGHSGWWG